MTYRPVTPKVRTDRPKCPIGQVVLLPQSNGEPAGLRSGIRLSPADRPDTPRSAVTQRGGVTRVNARRAGIALLDGMCAEAQKGFVTA